MTKVNTPLPWHQHHHHCNFFHKHLIHHHHEHWPNLQDQRVSLSSQEWRLMADEPTTMMTMFEPLVITVMLILTINATVIMFSPLYHHKCSKELAKWFLANRFESPAPPSLPQYVKKEKQNTLVLVWEVVPYDGGTPELVAAWHWYPPWSSSFTWQSLCYSTSTDGLQTFSVIWFLAQTLSHLVYSQCPLWAFWRVDHVESLEKW